MDAVTYPNEEVVSFIDENLVPLRVPSDSKPLSDDFNIKWTPALITLGSDGKEHHRTVGFLEPQAFMSQQLLGIGKYHFDNDRHSDALTIMEIILGDYPDSNAVPEAVFLMGVCRYKKSGDPKPLKEAYEKLNSEHPDSEWTQRAYPYRLL